MKLLFISRAYPPTVGGLERHNQALHETLQITTQVESIINRKGKKALPWFLPLATLQALYSAHKYDAILLGDGVLAVVGWTIKMFYPHKPVACIVHGLDITYTNSFYQFFWINRFLPKMDQIIAVSRATAEMAVQKGLADSQLSIIPNGVYRQEQSPRDKKKLDMLLSINAGSKIILLTVGRLVKRKGINWFIQNVMPALKNRCIYLIAGDGPEKPEIDKSIRNHGLQDVVHCCGFASEELKALLFANADLFVQPNIQVPGDMEGFGIAVLEANSYGLAVLGSKLEGLRDSISEDQNGWLLEPGDALAYIQKISELAEHPAELLHAGEKARDFCLQYFSWDRIAEQYLSALSGLAAPKP